MLNRLTSPAHARLAPRVLAAASLGAFLVMAGCGKADDASKNAAQSAAATQQAGAAAQAASDPMSIVMRPEMAARVKVDVVSVGETVETVRLPGRLDKNLYRTARIGSPVEGRVLRIRSVLGQSVREGEVMADISSQALATAQLTFLKAASNEQLQQRAVERAQLLLAADVIGSAELQRRQNELSVARAEKRAAFDQLRTVGLSARTIEEIERTGHINSVLPVTATRSGTVTERPIAEGQVVQPSDALFVVSDLSSVWAVADVPEQDIAQIQLGQRVEIEVPALDPGLLEGKIVFIADVVNPETRTVRVGVDLPNQNRQLKPQMLINMRIEARRSKRQLVPAGAVVREQDGDHVFVVAEANRATLQAVRLGPERNGMRPLLDRLPEGTRIVVDGAFHLNNERQRRNLEGTSDAVASASPKAAK